VTARKILALSDPRVIWDARAVGEYGCTGVPVLFLGRYKIQEVR